MPTAAGAAPGGYAPGDVVTVNGISVTAPLTAGSVALTVDRVDGTSETLLVTTHANGQVTVGDGTDAATSGVPAGGPSAEVRRPRVLAARRRKWPSAYNWHFRKASTPNELSKKQATKALKSAASNIATSNNDCGMADEVGLAVNYQGSTTQASDVTSVPTCVGSPQPQNVTEFGPITGGGGGILAATCTYTSGGTITNADVRMNTNFEWWTGGGCSGAFSVQGVQTHEYGHAVGVGHVTEAEHGNLTMSTNINGQCSHFEASMGEGDVLPCGTSTDQSLLIDRS